MPREPVAAPAPELGQRLADARAQAASAWARTTELRQQAERLLAEAQAIQRAIADAQCERRSSPAGRERLQRSEYARLLARLETMPVIEQAKGIIMVQSRCGEAEAFDTLRRASQRSNVPVRDLAARIVAQATGTALPEMTASGPPSAARRRIPRQGRNGSADCGVLPGGTYSCLGRPVSPLRVTLYTGFPDAPPSGNPVFFSRPIFPPRAASFPWPMCRMATTWDAHEETGAPGQRPGVGGVRTALLRRVPTGGDRVASTES